MKILLISLLIVLLGPQYGHGQYQIKNKEELEGFSAIPKETVFIHYNDNLLFAGEYLYYKLYCLTETPLKLSTLSRIAYVELVGQDRRHVFRHKISLNSGTGQGDFFIPTTVPTGNYKLIGYTQWMRNTVAKPYFETDLNIINPYLDISEISNTPIKEPLLEKYSGIDSTESTPLLAKGNPFRLNISKRKYGTREAVFVYIENESALSGHYSISVRRKHEFNYNSKVPTLAINTVFDANASSPALKLNDPIFLPELRGEIISGKITTDEEGSPIVDKRIGISIPSADNSILKIISTNDKGNFFAVINELRKDTRTKVQLIDSKTQNYKITNTTNQPLDYGQLKFAPFRSTPQMNEEILQQSIYNQIENAYYEQRMDSLLNTQSESILHEDLPEIYILDDYKRFPTLKETIVEIINDVFIKKVKGEYIFQVRMEDEFFVDSKDIPLVIVDGILVQDLKALLDYSARNIEKIKFARDTYYIGPKQYHGIISITTKEGNFASLIQLNNSADWDIPAPLAKKSYYTHKYSPNSTKKNKHLPDFRSQLLWEPVLNINEKTHEIQFYTSDNTGIFEISIAGFNKEGELVLLQEDFEVE